MFECTYLYLDADNNFSTKVKYLNDISILPILNIYENGINFPLVPVNVFKNPFENDFKFTLEIKVPDSDKTIPFTVTKLLVLCNSFDRVNAMGRLPDDLFLSYKQEFRLVHQSEYVVNKHIMNNFLEHVSYLCLSININISGYNVSSDKLIINVSNYHIVSADHLLVLRYIIETYANNCDYEVSMNNGAKCYINISNKSMRDSTTNQEFQDNINNFISNMSMNHKGNLKILTNDSEESEFTIDTFDTSKSINISADPVGTKKLFIKDCRPLATINPYKALYIYTRIFNYDTDATIINNYLDTVD